EAAEWMVDRALWPGRRRAVLDELAEHQRRGRRVLVVTGLFEPYLAAFMARLPGYEALGTPMIFEDGRVTGRLAGPFNIGRRKAASLGPFTRDGQIHAAYGDTFDDRHMLALSQEPVAVWPDARLRRLAQSRDWRVLEAA
ncbi:MAG TPA: haloacid dehalogenase-like hydrolase, partial [Desulfurivibrionaceae bacterium]|nr:haloacid dehalogenase-like hydrolase [Desulfurivibrionaceae bacterium]